MDIIKIISEKFANVLFCLLIILKILNLYMMDKIEIKFGFQIRQFSFLINGPLNHSKSYVLLVS
jgi:hypothetical protein